MTRLTYRANGDANSYALLDDTGNWFMSLLLNGRQMDAQQEASLRRLAACWNICEGFDTDTLEHIALLGETMLTRFQARDQVEQILIADRLRFMKERDEARHVIHQIMEIVDKRQVADFVEKFGELPARARPPAPRSPTTNTCTGGEPKCKWVPDGVGTRCTTCGDSIPF